MASIEVLLGRIDERTVLIHEDLKEFKLEVAVQRREQLTVNGTQQTSIDSLRMWRAWLAGGIAFLTLAGTVAFRLAAF